MGRAPDSLTELMRETIEPMGYELVGAEYMGDGRAGYILRIYIDHENGISVDDCSTVSHQVSGVLDVEDPIHEKYALEVSSPGLDRPLFFKEHFERFKGSRVRIRLHEKMHGRRRFDGVLNGLQSDDVLVDVDGEEFVLPYDLIDKARLVADF
ncbi:ribosome maturation factor RimP [Solemya velesiana gill symbiont]|uniref:Ribosome maturation factor RimP n=1 Tax=Solemya velesiana gill symbiont TaxID=1918948 RepID=A0A1T2KVT0_9GAMM|nr:ribosome maturation factor RimP [Solemya velesiana gill symbiont]OOZ36978.1 ribosome maturation factor RimP [Solemya velesiana gill symbiont]